MQSLYELELQRTMSQSTNHNTDPLTGGKQGVASNPSKIYVLAKNIMGGPRGGSLDARRAPSDNYQLK